MAGPLEGIKVIDWTQWQMGTVATAMLGDLGATVVHVENRITGDTGRGLALRGLPRDIKGRSAYFEYVNRGKKGITLDVAKEKGKEVMYRLVKQADIFVHNFRQGVPERLKLDYGTLCQHNPQIIYAAASGYGPKGPEAEEPALDPMGIARSGIMYLVDGDENMPPQPIFGGIADQMGAVMTAYGILVALIARERLGIGQKVDSSHLGSMIALEGLSVSFEGTFGELGRTALIRRSRKMANNPLMNYFQCKDGKWLQLGMLQSDRYWPTVCKGLGIEHLEKDPRFENAAKRAENCEEINTILDQRFITKSAAEWMTILKAAGDVICVPVQSISDLFNDPQVKANGYIIDCQHEVLGAIKAVGLPIHLSKTPGAVNCQAPEFGQHTEEVLAEMGGYSWEEITRLREEEVI
jgi:crotonobetainyl-CoA:carnitine CoA-transferase CaiB-like acyl-CoA transferase